MALLHALKFNNNTTDAITGTRTVNGTVTSQATQGMNGNYYFNTGNLYLSETKSNSYAGLMCLAKNRSSSDPDGKIVDSRGGSSHFILSWGPGAKEFNYYISGSAKSYTYGSWTTQIHLGLVYDGANIILYIEGVAKSSLSAASKTWNYTSIRIGQENAGSPNRRFLGDLDEYRLFNHALSPADVKNDCAYYKGFF